VQFILWTLGAVLLFLLSRSFFSKKQQQKSLNSMDDMQKMAWHKECLLQAPALAESLQHLEALEKIATKHGIHWNSEELRNILAKARTSTGRSGDRSQVIHQDGEFWDQEAELVDSLPPLELLQNPPDLLNGFLRLYSPVAQSKTLDAMIETHPEKKQEMVEFKTEWDSFNAELSLAGIDPDHLKDLHLKRVQLEQRLTSIVEGSNGKR